MKIRNTTFLLSLFFLLMSSSILISCKSTEQSETDSRTIQDVIDSMPDMSEFEPTGEVVGRIDFKTKVVDSASLEIFEDGIIPWISLENPEGEIMNLLDSDEMVVSNTKAVVVIDYPVEKPVRFPIESNTEEGFTRKELILKISAIYKQMYIDEEASATTKTLPIEERSIANRNTTDGKYGIWGHDLSDLDLSYIEVRKQADGRLFLYLWVKS